MDTMQKEQISRFWDNYINITKTYNVPPKSARWYVMHVERYIKAHPALRLALHTEQNVTSYLDDLGRTGNLTDWQFKQVVDALRILFVDIVRTPWVAAFPWRYWADSATALPKDHATLARDYSRNAASDPDKDSKPQLSTSDSSFIQSVSRAKGSEYLKSRE